MPQIEKNVFIAKNASVVGDVSIGPDSSVWFGAVIRGDMNRIKIGSRTNVQDNSIVHVPKDLSTTIGDDVTVGHGAIVHGCEIGNRVLIGMGSIVMDGAKIGEDCIIGAGSLVTQQKIFPSKSMIIGSPAKVVRELTDEELKAILNSAEEYAKLAREYMVT